MASQATTATQTTYASNALGRPTELDLSAFDLDVPRGTTATVEVHGSRDAFEIVLERRGDRWIVEGAGNNAELTGVHGPDDPSMPDRVPGWIARVIEEYGVREVSVYR